MLHVTKHGLEGDSAAARAAMAAIEAARASRGDPTTPLTFVTVYVRPGSVTYALKSLRMARKLDRYRETARMVLDPLIVEEALARLDRRLTLAEQDIVVAATRTPWKVRWPDWWNGNN